MTQLLDIVVLFFRITGVLGMRRNTFVFSGRFCVSTCMWLSKEEKEQSIGVSIYDVAIL